MRIKLSQLRQIIKEEVARSMMSEGPKEDLARRDELFKDVVQFSTLFTSLVNKGMTFEEAANLLDEAKSQYVGVMSKLSAWNKASKSAEGYLPLKADQLFTVIMRIYSDKKVKGNPEGLKTLYGFRPNQLGDKPLPEGYYEAGSALEEVAESLKDPFDMMLRNFFEKETRSAKEVAGKVEEFIELDSQFQTSTSIDPGTSKQRAVVTHKPTGATVAMGKQY